MSFGSWFPSSIPELACFLFLWTWVIFQPADEEDITQRALCLCLSLSLSLCLCNVLSHFLVPSLCGCFPRSCVGSFGLCGGLGAREEEETHRENAFLHLRKQLTQLPLLAFEGASDHHNHLQGFPSKRSVSTFENLIVCQSSEQSSDKISNRASRTSTHTSKKGC